MKLAEPTAARLLEQSLLITFVLHAVAMATMALCLLPGMPGGGELDVLRRAAYVADHPWLWRLGWLGWQLTALSDVLLAVALLRTDWVPRLPAWAVLATTLAAVVPDQFGQAWWVTAGIDHARAALTDGPAAYEALEAHYFRMIAGWGATLYMVGALGWTWCFVAAGTWSRGLTWLSLATWGVLGFAATAPLLPEAGRPSSAVIAVANALGFCLLEAWFVLVTEQVLRRSRPDAAHGRLAPWRHPSRGLLGQACAGIANSRFLRGLAEWLPPVAFRSDITDVIYVNYLVDADRLTSLVPSGLELQRLGPRGDRALFTFLSYRHGHFGPRLLGPLRRLLPSPVQTNWRIHVRDPRTGKTGIYFVTNAIDATPHALAARLLSEGMPMHLLRRAEVSVQPNGTYRLALDPGAGSGPMAEAELRPGAAELPAAWREVFPDYRAFLAYCVPQDRALSSQPWYRRVTRQEIELGIPLEACEPLDGEVRSASATAVVGEAAPVCFRVARVRFLFEREAYDRW